MHFLEHSDVWGDQQSNMFWVEINFIQFQHDFDDEWIKPWLNWNLNSSIMIEASEIIQSNPYSRMDIYLNTIPPSRFFSIPMTQILIYLRIESSIG